MMKRNIATLCDQEFDLIVIGGGIFGVCMAWDATLRGLSVALVEKRDFAHATSSNHFRIIHGGIRYLQHGDLYRVRESSQERSSFLRVAPHLTHPLPIFMPTYGHGMKGKEILRAGVWLYDLLTWDRNRGIKDPQRHTPRGYTVSREECLELFPHLDPNGLTGAVVFHDGQMYNPARIVLSFLRSAVENGAQAANYLEATGLLQDKNRVTGIRARDLTTGDELEVRGRMVLNATGPWADRLLSGWLGLGLQPQPSFSRDVCFVVKGRRLNDKYALALQARSKDPDALLSRGHRHLFVVPWQEHTLIGVWHTVHTGTPEDFTITAEELEGFLDEINVAYPGLNVTVDDIRMWNTGLILFGENRPGEQDLSFGKRSIILDHAQEHQVEGLITIIGVRYTTAPGVAAKVVDLALEKMGKEPSRSNLSETPIFGGKIESFEALVQQVTERHAPQVCTDLIPALIHNYGSDYHTVFKYIDENPRWAESVDSAHVIKAEVVHAVREEMAQKLEDVVFRRTDLGTAGHPGDRALESCADLMATELSWDKDRQQRELAAVQAAFVPLWEREKS